MHWRLGHRELCWSHSPQYRLPITASNAIFCTFRHSVSLNECRAKFKPNLWNRPNDRERLLSITDQQIQRHHHHHDRGGNYAHVNGRRMRAQKRIEQHYSQDRTKETDIDEVWFAGCDCGASLPRVTLTQRSDHSVFLVQTHVGGGSVDNKTTTIPARIPLLELRTNAGRACSAWRSRGEGEVRDCQHRCQHGDWPFLQLVISAPDPHRGRAFRGVPRASCSNAVHFPSSEATPTTPESSSCGFNLTFVA
ncbi:unnamed protein product [Mycena citricolor]|nr:unnamed protein product [Mycena citricolor]